MTFAPMLAVSAPCTAETIARLQGTHWFDFKIDGVRCLAIMNAGTVKLQNRNGVDVTYRYPEIVQSLLDCFGTDIRLILDGEVAVTALDENGARKPSFRLTARRDRQQKPAIINALSKSLPAHFYVFDLLYRGSGPGADRRNRPFCERRDELGELLDACVMNGEWSRISGCSGGADGELCMELVRMHHLEGLVAKRLDSPYQSGRHSQWVKIKPSLTGSFIVTGSTVGSGVRQETFGALSLAVTLPDGNLLPVGEVGSGFKARDLREITAILATGQELIVEVEFMEYTEDGSLRFPVFRGIRTDVLRADVNYRQLGERACDRLKSSLATSSTATSPPGST